MNQNILQKESAYPLGSAIPMKQVQKRHQKNANNQKSLRLTADALKVNFGGTVTEADVIKESVK